VANGQFRKRIAWTFLPPSFTIISICKAQQVLQETVIRDEAGQPPGGSLLHLLLRGLLTSQRQRPSIGVRFSKLIKECKLQSKRRIGLVLMGAMF